MRLWTIIFVTLLAISANCQSDPVDDNKAYFYVGTYTAHLSPEDSARAGISLWSVHLDTGALALEKGPWTAVNPSYLSIAKDRKHLYSVNAVGDYRGTKSGYLTHYAIDLESMELTQISTVSSNGPGPAYLSVNKSGKHLFLANYGAGNIVAYPIASDGHLGLPTANVQHIGSSSNPRRQEAPHPHSIIQSPDSRYVFVPDLGLDRIKAYAFDNETGTLEPKPDLDVTTPSGSGPRHLVFHPSGKFAFCSLEMGNEVVAYRYADGTLTPLASYSTLPEDFQGDSTTAEVRVSPNGKHVYISNRGHDSIAAFRLDRDTGTLEQIQIISTGGKTPRNFALDPAGRMLVVGNQQSDNMAGFHVDQDSGKLSPTGTFTTIPAPTYIRFY